MTSEHDAGLADLRPQTGDVVEQTAERLRIVQVDDEGGRRVHEQDGIVAPLRERHDAHPVFQRNPLPRRKDPHIEALFAQIRVHLHSEKGRKKDRPRARLQPPKARGVQVIGMLVRDVDEGRGLDTPDLLFGRRIDHPPAPPVAGAEKPGIGGKNGPLLLARKNHTGMAHGTDLHHRFPIPETGRRKPVQGIA
jgi:hypothetical protein